MPIEESAGLVATLRDYQRRIADLEVQEFFDPLSGARYTILAIVPTVSNGDRSVVTWLPGTHIKGLIQSWRLLDDGGTSGNASLACKRATFDQFPTFYQTMGLMTISSSHKGQGDVSTWTYSTIYHGDVLAFEMTADATTSGPITVALEVLLAGDS